MVVTIANPNPFPVTISAVNLPTTTTYASGYTTSALATTQTGCIATTPSGVTWNFATAISGSSHTLRSAVTVGASGAAEQPPGGDAHERRPHGDDLAGGMCQHLLLHAGSHRRDGDRWRGHLDDEPGDRLLDQLVTLVAPPSTERQRRGEPARATWRSSRRCRGGGRPEPPRLVRDGLGDGQLDRPCGHRELGGGPCAGFAGRAHADVRLHQPGQRQDGQGQLDRRHPCHGLRGLPIEHHGDRDVHAPDSGVATTSWTTAALATGDYWYEVVADVGSNWASAKSAASAERIISSSACS